ncbi:hypothetical protein J6590_041053 [Homalodisca vitripennis]|nr:hypothetical protein J6590_095891 [Homalodisca vitripennis]KAG8331445.1 hypothetical protein J6590_041053 [Homalodisca vitripennis]
MEKLIKITIKSVCTTLWGWPAVKVTSIHYYCVFRPHRGEPDRFSAPAVFIFNTSTIVYGRPAVGVGQHSASLSLFESPESELLPPNDTASIGQKRKGSAQSRLGCPRIL